MITGRTKLIVHLGYPTESFKAPMIYNPWFEMKGIEAVVVPVGVEPKNYAEVLTVLFHTTNVHGALVTMPHKVTTTHLVNEMTTTAKIAGACNAILRRPDGSLLGDMFDGAGFVRGVERKGKAIAGARAAGGWLRRCGVGDRRVAGGVGAVGDRSVRSGQRLGRGAGRSPAATLPGAGSRHRFERSRRLRHRRQRDTAGDETRRSAADRCTRMHLLICVHPRASVVDFSCSPTVRSNVGVYFHGSARKSWAAGLGHTMTKSKISRPLRTRVIPRTAATKRHFFEFSR
jgi:hypothetical protein